MKEIKYLMSAGSLRRKDNTIMFYTEDGKKHYLPVENTSQIMLFGEIDINKRVLEFFTQKEISVHFFSYYGYYMGTYYPREHYNSGYMILRQANNFYKMNKRLGIAKLIVKGAYSNIVKILSYYKNKRENIDDVLEEIKECKEGLKNAENINILMSNEANLRKIYYKAFDIILNNSDFRFEKRSKRPPKNQLNTLISFGNSLLYVTVLSEIYKTHLDPRIGYLHETNFRRFSLNLDIAEIFKPIIVDRLIFSLINKKEIQSSHFSKELDGIILNEAGRRKFIENYDK
ncbi:MAG: type I-B CRISPR-associated endonuclease Cas1b, partial [Spirochaetota bacterium]